MQPEIGNIYEGKVTGITKFGAFVELEPGVSGMVHISEVANTFVSEIRDHLTEGDTVKVKVIGISEEGKISLSIKKAVPRPSNTGRPAGRGPAPAGRGPAPVGRGPAPAGRKPAGEPQTAQSSFEDMLSRFKASSDERMGDIKRNMDSKRRGSRRK
ncbi:MAG: S1 RNA-binding domain-containing protein [Oscillospiraceae bacterium]|nr:S1 RNA-binding domain-containing protein [Oscillospiraceae bacterium]